MKTDNDSMTEEERDAAMDYIPTEAYRLLGELLEGLQGIDWTGEVELTEEQIEAFDLHDQTQENEMRCFLNRALSAIINECYSIED